MAGAENTAPACTGEVSTPLAEQIPADELIDGCSPIRERLVLRADATVLGAHGKTSAPAATTIAIVCANPATRITPAAPGTLRHRPVVILATVQTFSTGWHKGDFRGLIKLDLWRGEWEAPIRTQGCRSRPHGDGSQALAA